MRWNKFGTFIAVRSLCAAVILLAGSTAAEATNCLVALDLAEEDRAYECDFKSDQGDQLEGTLLFGDLDGDSFTVSLDLEETGATLGYCSCKARAGFHGAQFGASRSFSCVTPLAGDLAESMEGQLTGNGKKINKGQMLSILSYGAEGEANLLSMRFRCKSDKGKKNKK